MIKKRFTLEMQYWKGLPQGRKLFDNLTGQDGMSVEELCNIASDLHSKCEELESVLKVYEDCLGEFEDENKKLQKENEQLKQYKQAVNDVLDSYYQRDLTPIEEILVGRIAKELNVDLHYKYKGDVDD